MRTRRRLGLTLVGAGLLAVMCTPPAGAQTGRSQDDVWRELGVLKQGQSAILKELQALRTLLLGAAAKGTTGPRADAVLSVQGAPYLGTPIAPVTVLEFSDYQ